MKVIRIENCTECPFYRPSMGVLVFCSKMDKLIGDYNGLPECPIPEWCPLDDEDDNEWETSSDRYHSP